jgi:mono/diheme cytochrome c family protein
MGTVYNGYFLSLFWVFTFFIIVKSHVCAQDIPADNARLVHGEKLFLHNCFICHEIGREAIGPALVNIPDKRPVDWLFRFIRNSQQMIVDNDSIAAFLYKQYNHNVMPSFYRFSDEDILDILGYIKKHSVTEFKEDRNVKEAPEVIIEGKQLFNNQCSQCHGIGHQIIGPGLASVPKTRTKKWLIDFIKNSQKVIQSGEPHANLLYKNFKSTKMPSFDYLSDVQINHILLFINSMSEAPVYVAGVNGKKVLHENPRNIKVSPPQKEVSYHSFFISKVAIALAGILLVVIKVILGIKVFKGLIKSNRKKYKFIAFSFFS